MNASGSQKGLRALLLCLLALVLVFAWLIRSTYSSESFGAAESIDSLYRLADEGRIESARLLDEDAQVVGTKRTGCQPPPAPGQPPTCSGPLVRFQAAYPRSDVGTQQLIDRLSARGARVVVDQQSGKAVKKLLITFVFPLLILANLFGIIFMARGDSSLADIAGFGTVGRKRQRRRATSTLTFADVAGADEAVEELREVIDYLTNPEKFEAYGAAPPKGVLLFGPPGCGKTLLARATAGESGVPFLSVSGAEFVESLVGVGAARVRDLFRQVRELAPAIVFIDEIDAVGRRRGGEGSTGGEREQTVNQLLVEMDGFEVSSGVVLMGATNRPDIIDPALLRPGRFDRHVTLQAPDIHGRQAILELHAANKPVGGDVDFEFFARRTPGFTGADLANVINEAALLAIREGGVTITSRHLSDAIVRVLHGPQRRGQLLSADERRRIAFHESGHAVTASANGRQSQVHRVSIMARGRGLGQSTIAEEADHALLTEDEFETQLTITMGGVAAEMLVFGQPSTAAEDDIEKATGLAREMVGVYGMSNRIGRVRLLSRGDGFLGDGAVLDSISEHTMVELDREVKQLIDAAERRAVELLTRHREVLDRLASRLESEETLEGAPLQSLLAAARVSDGKTRRERVRTSP